jgi:hypothetical protein
MRISRPSCSALLLSYSPYNRTSGKSTQKAFMFMPYRKPAKLSEKRAKLSCINCSCRKFCSRSAMASLSSANPSWRPSSAFPDEAAPRPLCTLSRNELREDGRRGVVGRLRGDLLRVLWRCEGGSPIEGSISANTPDRYKVHEHTRRGCRRHCSVA